MSSSPISIRVVQSKQSLNDFLKVPWSVYKSDDLWVPPLNFERKLALSPTQGIFKHLEWKGWVAYQNDQPVGRISAQIDQLYLEHTDSKTGFFGFLEAQNDQNIFRPLFESAESWLKQKNMSRIVGPFSLNVNQEAGNLIEGFDSEPYFMTPNGLRYYGAQIENCGYEKAMDLYAYLIKPRLTPSKIEATLLHRMPETLKTRSIDRKNLINELETIRAIFNDAWSNNWGFIPFTKDEFQAIGREMLTIIPDNFIQIAEIDREPMAFIVMLPNLNEATKDLDGRLWPLGWLKLLYRLKIKYPKTARIPLMGIRKRFHSTRLGAGLALSVINALRKPSALKQIENIEMSWILENNNSMSKIIKAVGGTRSKTYRVYEKNISFDQVSA